MKKRYKFLIGLLSLALIGLVFVVEYMMPYMGIIPGHLKPDASQYWRYPKGIAPENYGLKAQRLTVKTKDGIALSAWLTQSHLDSTYGTVIVLHGISSCKETQFNRAAILASIGYAALLLDLRAHGESEGTYNTFGDKEKYDIKSVVDTLQKLFPNRKVGIWGASLGGAIAIQALGIDPRFQFGVIESTFDEYNKVATEYGSRYLLGIKSQWLTQRVLSKSGKIADFEPDSVKPILFCPKIRQSILFIHGDHDERIPISFNRRNFEACASADKQWITVNGGRHNNIWQAGGDVLQQQALSFLEKQKLNQ